MDIGTSHKLGVSSGSNGDGVRGGGTTRRSDLQKQQRAGGGKRRGSAYDEASNIYPPETRRRASITELILWMVSKSSSARSQRVCGVDMSLVSRLSLWLNACVMPPASLCCVIWPVVVHAHYRIHRNSNHTSHIGHVKPHFSSRINRYYGPMWLVHPLNLTRSSK